MASPEHPSTRKPWMIAASVAFVLVLVVGAFLVGRSDDDESATTSTTSSTSTSTTEPPTTTSSTAQPTSTTSAPPATVDTATAVWPSAGSGTRYVDPTEAARGFAVDLVGFTDPLVGPFMAGDSRSGEVEIRADESGPVTTVFVRQLSGSDDWWVLGAATANIQISQPAALDAISSPVTLAGTSTAFEANVSVRLHQDGSTEPIATGFVMGGSMGEMGPFTGELAFEAPTASHGALVLLTESMRDGTVWEASVVRVAFR